MKLRILPIISALCASAVLAQTYPHLFVTKRASASAPPVLYDYDSAPHPMDTARVRSIVHDTATTLRARLADTSSTLRTALATKQPLDADLTAIAALSTQPFGRSLLTQTDAPTARTTLGAQAALGYTPVNKSGDTMTGALAVATATGGVTVGTDTSTATEVLLKAASASQAQLRIRLASGDGLRLYSSATEGGIASVDGGTANYPLTFVKGDVNGAMTIRRPLKVTNQAGTGNRLVQASSDGTQSASIHVPTAFIQTLFDDADQAAARATLGVAVAKMSLVSADVSYPVPEGSGAITAISPTVTFPANFWTAGKLVHFEAICLSGSTYSTTNGIAFNGNIAGMSTGLPEDPFRYSADFLCKSVIGGVATILATVNIVRTNSESPINVWFIATVTHTVVNTSTIYVGTTQNAETRNGTCKLAVVEYVN